jgi:hypothetical protein
MAMKFEELVSRVMKDAKFRDELKADPAKALQSVGVKSTPDLERSVRSLDWGSLDTVNQHYKAASGIST